MSELTPRILPREIGTDRLLLRAVNTDDAADQADAVKTSLADLRVWLPWAQQAQSTAEAASNLAAAAARFDAGEEFNWTIRDATSLAFIGRVSVLAVDWRVPKGEIGYWLASARTQLGYMREAVNAVVEAAEAAGFRRIEIRCDRLNTRSARVPEALGFKEDAILENDDVAAADQSVLRDTRIFSRTQ